MSILLSNIQVVNAILWSGSSQTIVGKKVLSFANILPRSKEES